MDSAIKGFHHFNVFKRVELLTLLADPSCCHVQWVIRRDQSILQKKMNYFKMEIASMALPVCSQTQLYGNYKQETKPNKAHL
jgi:hypothetical protein